MPSPPAAGAPEPRLRKRLYGIAQQIGAAENAGKYSKEELRTLAQMRVRLHQKKSEPSAPDPNPDPVSKKTAYQRKYRAEVRARVDEVVSRIMTYREAPSYFNKDFIFETLS